MLIHINSYPGVGKLTIGRLLAERMNARLLDNHSVYNVAFALTEFKSPAFYETVRAVRTIAYARALELPPSAPLILTNAHAQDSAWGHECWDAAIDLAHARGSELFVVILICAPEENARRIQSPDRDLKRKPRDPSMSSGNLNGRPLLDRGGDHLLRLDITTMTAIEAAATIHSWIEGLTASR